MGLKDFWTQAKQKLQDTIDKGNSELKKYSASAQMTIYSKPIFGGFVTKQVFEGEEELFVPTQAFKENAIELNTIFRLKEKNDIFVVTFIDTEEYIEELTTEGKTYQYPCHIVKYRLLSDVFTEETMHMSYQELTPLQHDTLNQIQKEIEEKSFVYSSKKEACQKLWQYFTECISYQQNTHYVLDTFVKIADDLVEDFSVLLLKLFA